MFFRRSGGFFFTPRIFPPVIPRMTPDLSFNPLKKKDRHIGDDLDGAGVVIAVAVAAIAGVGSLIVECFRRGPKDDESAAPPARKKEEDRKALAEYFRKGPDVDESAAPPARKIEEDRKALAEHFRKGPDDDEPAARKKEEDMKARFEDWMKSYDKTYRDEKEKAMRSQVFKDTMKWIESQLPSTQEKLLPGNCFADLRKEELPCSQSCIHGSDDPR